MEGIPDDIRSNPSTMKGIMDACRKTPNQKYDLVASFAKKLFGQKSLKSWGLEIDTNPMEIQSKILALPEMELNDHSIVSCSPNDLRRLPCQNPIPLNENQWLIVYESKNYKQADNTLRNFKGACD